MNLQLTSGSFTVAVVGPVVKEPFSELMGVEFFPTLKSFMEKSSGFDVLVYRGEDKLDDAFFALAKSLKLVVKPAVGVDNIDLQAAEKFNVKIRNVPSGSTVSVAEFTICAIISLLRKFPQAHTSTKRGEWRKSDFHGLELNGKTVGVIGLGRIGMGVAERLKVFGVNLVGFDPYLPAERFNGIKQMNCVDDLLKASDIITVHIPLENSTRNLINSENLKLVKKGALLVNTSRGEIVEEKALIDAVKSGVLGGVALDVFPQEPLEKCELHELDNVILTPHIAASTVDAQLRISQEVVAIISEFQSMGEVVAIPTQKN